MWCLTSPPWKLLALHCGCSSDDTPSLLPAPSEKHQYVNKAFNSLRQGCDTGGSCASIRYNNKSAVFCVCVIAPPPTHTVCLA